MIINAIKIKERNILLDSVFKKIAFLRSEYPDFYRWYHDTVLNGLSAGTRNIYLAKSFGEIKGVLILKNTSQEKKICTLYVDEFSRSNGIGSRLMNIAMNEFHGENPLITVADNHIKDFRPLLSNYGFREEDTLPNYYTSGRIEYTFNGHLYLSESKKNA